MILYYTFCLILFSNLNWLVSVTFFKSFFRFLGKGRGFSENDFKFNILNRISGRDSSPQQKKIRRLETTIVYNTKCNSYIGKEKHCSIKNFLNNQACKYHVYKWVRKFSVVEWDFFFFFRTALSEFGAHVILINLTREK